MRVMEGEKRGEMLDPLKNMGVSFCLTLLIGENWTFQRKESRAAERPAHRKGK